MGLEYLSLNENIRAHMLSEYQRDVNAGTLFSSDNLSPTGKASYPGILKSVFAQSEDNNLAALVLPLLNTHEKPRVGKNGTVSTPKMRSNAHTMLAEGEFNRFYMRGVCVHAIANGIPEVLVYRARYSENPRPESEAKIGQMVNAALLLADLRENIGLDTYLGLPGGPNSGLSVRLPE